MQEPFMPFLSSEPFPPEDKKKADVCPHPESYRIRPGLEWVTFDSLSMVETLRAEVQPNSELWRIILANDGTTSRVHPGDSMGLNSGKVMGVYED